MSSASPSVALVTISYARDFERCELLVKTVERHAQDAFIHYLVVDRRDVTLFQRLSSPSCKVLVLEDLLPWWIFRTRWSGRFWISLKTLPVRGWIIQQIAKMSIFAAIPEDIAVHCDSDCFFLRSFSLRQLVHTDQGTRLQLVPFENAERRRWNETSVRLFGRPASEAAAGSFVGNLIPFRRDVMRILHERLAGQARKSWTAVLASQLSFSEYSIYGSFVTQILGLEAAGHRIDNTPIMRLGYGLDPSDERAWHAFFCELGPTDVGAMIHSKDGIEVAQYRRYVLP